MNDVFDNLIQQNLESQRADIGSVLNMSPMFDADAMEINERWIRFNDRWVADFASCNYLGYDLEDKIIESIATGISVVHGDLNHKLDFADDYSFDYVVVSNTLQEVERPDHLLQEVVRVGKKALVSFINFANIKTRSQLFLKGKMPETKNLPHHWYNTPNIHLATICDFRELCRLLNIKIIKEIPLGSNGNLLAKALPNLFAANCVFEITSAKADF